MRDFRIDRRRLAVTFVSCWLGWQMCLPAAQAGETVSSPSPTAVAAPLIKAGEKLSLKEVVEIARHAQPNLLAAQGSINANQSKVGQAESALLPQVSGTVSYTRLSPSGTYAMPIDDDTSHSQYSSGITANQLLYDFGRTTTQIAARKTTVDSSRADLASVDDQVAFSVKLAYFALLKAERTRDVAAKTVQQFEQHLDQAKQFFAAGVKPKYDVTKAEVDLSNAKLNLIRAENGRNLARVSLNTAMGVPEAPAYEVVDSLDFQPFTLPLTSALDKAYGQRPDLKALLLRKKANEQLLDLARKGDYPVVTGNAGASYGGGDFPLDEGWSVGVALSVPLANGHRTRHEVGEAQANVDILAANETALRQSIYKEVQQSYLNLQEAESRIQTTQLTVKQAEENVEIAVGRYKAGVGNPVEVADGDVSLLNARTNHIEALYDYKIAQVSIEKAIGHCDTDLAN